MQTPKLLWMMLLACCLPYSLQAESLDQALGSDTTHPDSSSPQTQQTWQQLLRAASDGDLTTAKARALQFKSVVDFTEPYQKTFADLAIEIIDFNSNLAEVGKPPANTDHAGQMDEAKASIASLKNNISQLNQTIATDRASIETERAKLPAIDKKLHDAQSGAAITNFILGNSSLSNPGVSNALREKQDVDNTIRSLNADIDRCNAQIAGFSSKIDQLQNQLQLQSRQDSLEANNQLARQAQAQEDTRQRFQTRVSLYISQLIQTGYFNPAIAVANLYLKAVGPDQAISHQSQAALDEQKLQAKAVEIARSILPQVENLLNDHQVWTAQKELDKDRKTIADRVQDPRLIKYINTELGEIQRKVETQLQDAMERLKVILAVGQRDAVEGLRQLAEFHQAYPDCPYFGQARINLQDLHANQVQQKFATRLLAIDEVIHNDPDQAKEMIGKLLKTDADQEEAFILKARISALRRKILEQEAANIQSRMDEAQGYLTSYNVSYAKGLKESGRAKLGYFQQLSLGTENLVRARSIQVGAVKQLEILLQEEMDTTTRAKLTGLLETQKAAIEQMDDTLNQRRNGLWVLGGLGILLLVACGLVAGWLFLRKPSSNLLTKPEPQV